VSIPTRLVWEPQVGPQFAAVVCPIEEIFFGGSRGGGKVQPVDANVLTPFGWKAIGTLRVGSKICAIDGSVCDVIGVHPQGIIDAYQVTMSDGGKTEVGLEHLWLAWEANKTKKKAGKKTTGESSALIYTTADIKKRMERKSTKIRFAVPVTDAVAFNVSCRRPRAIDPYLLGLLLGDGHLGAVVGVTSMDREIGDFLYVISSQDCTETTDQRSRASAFNFIGEFKKRLATHLDKLGLRGKHSHEKFVPREYLWGPTDIRRSLLQGLMDTDGWVEPKRCAFYCTTSPQLRDDVKFLAQSLGCVVTICEKNSTYTYKGEKLSGKKAYTLRIKSKEPETLFRLSRKRTIAKHIDHQTDGRWIEKISFKRRVEGVCIAVSHPSRLYITDDFIVTHNTEASLGRAMLRAIKYKKNYKGYFIRRELVQLEPAISRSKEIYYPLGGQFNEQKKNWLMPGGGSLTFRYIERDSDAEKFQGDSCSDINIEEIGNFPDLDPLLKLKGILRSVGGVPSSFFATGNPGGPGHSLVKRRYIDPAPPWDVISEVDKITGLTNERVYIPSRITDNKKLLDNDPGYLSRLAQTGSPELVKAWIDGNFDAIDGAFFSEFDSSRHVLTPCTLPAHWVRFRSADWGSYYPFAVVWCAITSEDWRHPGSKKIIPANSIIVYREWYGSQDHNNKGLKLTAEDFARQLVKLDGQDKFKYSVMDPSAFKKDGGPSVAERINRAQRSAAFSRADNARVGSDGAMGGWDHVRGRLIGHPIADSEDTVPSLYIFSTCRDLIRTLPALQHDKNHPEDLMGSEDHLADALRYGIMSRPTASKPATRRRPMRDFRHSSLDELWSVEDAKRSRRLSHRI
jgi:hypothetical protein